jgi:DNA-binding Lrp family transcriptional regulator
MPFEALAKKHQMTANAVKKRVDKMEKSGVILRYTVELTPEMIEAEVLLAFVSTDGRQDEEEFANVLGNYPLVFDVSPLTGAIFLVFADYTSSAEFSELGRFIRAQPGVKDVELHTLLRFRERDMSEFSNLDLRVLKVLVEDDVRMSISSIAEKTGLTARRVRRVINDLLEGNSVRFTIKWNPEASKGIPFIIRITYDESAVETTYLEKSLLDKFPIALWETMISSSGPTIFAYFVAQDQTHLEQIVRDVRKIGNVDSVVSFVNKPTKIFQGPRYHKLAEMLQLLDSS